MGENERSISTLDADGVALTGIQGLYQILLEKSLQIERLLERVEELEAKVSETSDGG